jgi:prephenate dehydrogenase
MNAEGLFNRIGIVGVGLIGGSLGLAIKRSLPDTRILGIGRDPARLATAQAIGAVDWIEPIDGPGIGSCDLVILATPVEHILAILETIGRQLAPGTLVADVGSTKRLICRKAWDRLPATVEFIGGHPVAGRELTGIEHSLPDLFDRAAYVLCPEAGRAARNLEKMCTLVEHISACPVVMTPDEHDTAIAWVSHLPQLLSTSLANVVGGKGTEISGSGLRDMLRLAGSSYAVWKGIFESNADNVDEALTAFIRQLERVRDGLRDGSISGEFDAAMQTYQRVRQAR